MDLNINLQFIAGCYFVTSLSVKTIPNRVIPQYFDGNVNGSVCIYTHVP